MSVGEGIRRADGALLDNVFQPIADRLPGEGSSWSLGMSCQLGSVVFQVISIVIPLLFSVSIDMVVQSILVLLCSFIIFLAFQRSRSLVRPDMMNPLRHTMFGMRIVGIGFIIYNGFTDLKIYSDNFYLLISNYLGFLSLFVFVVGLYFMACQMRPPKKRQASSWRSVLRKRAIVR